MFQEREIKIQKQVQIKKELCGKRSCWHWIEKLFCLNFDSRFFNPLNLYRSSSPPKTCSNNWASYHLGLVLASFVQVFIVPLSWSTSKWKLFWNCLRTIYCCKFSSDQGVVVAQRSLSRFSPGFDSRHSHRVPLISKWTAPIERTHLVQSRGPQI